MEQEPNEKERAGFREGSVEASKFRESLQAGFWRYWARFQQRFWTRFAEKGGGCRKPLKFGERKVPHKAAGRFWEVLDKVTYGRTFLLNFV